MQFKSVDKQFGTLGVSAAGEGQSRQNAGGPNSFGVGSYPSNTFASLKKGVEIGK